MVRHIWREAAAFDEKRILLTFDKDFGEPAEEIGAATYLRCHLVAHTDANAPGKSDSGLPTIITRRDDWAGYFPVIKAPAAFECDHPDGVYIVGGTGAWG